MSKIRKYIKKVCSNHGIVSELHRLEDKLYEMLEASDFRSSDELLENTRPIP
ncbi:MAG: hypothetical protein WB053_09600 [Nitrososphaeraceae archaeon]|jgi:hypothetical protein